MRDSTTRDSTRSERPGPFRIDCRHCNATSHGRPIYPSFVGRDARYCDRCANLKLWIDGASTGPGTCECGGHFQSYELLCPSCSEVIDDAEKQLAVFFYIIEPSEVPGYPTSAEIDEWYRQRRAERFLTGTELFVQLSRILQQDRDSKEWTYRDASTQELRPRRGDSF